MLLMHSIIFFQIDFLFLLIFSKDAQEQTTVPTFATKKVMKCSLCGIEGHKANNKHFHPDGNPRAKPVLSRPAKKNAPFQPPRNSGEIDDEVENNAETLHSDDEDNDSDGDNDLDYGEDNLEWVEDLESSEVVEMGPNGLPQQQLPLILGDYAGPCVPEDFDAPASTVLDHFFLFFTTEMLDKMPLTILGLIINQNISTTEFKAFLGLIIYMGLINYKGTRRKLWAKDWKGNEFVRTVMNWGRNAKLVSIGR